MANRERDKPTAGGGSMAGGTVPGGKGPTDGTGPGPEPIRVPVDDQDRRPLEENASEGTTGKGDMARRHDALEGEGAMEPPGWTED